MSARKAAQRIVRRLHIMHPQHIGPLQGQRNCHADGSGEQLVEWTPQKLPQESLSRVADKDWPAE